jgi:Ca-activated chloride channel family protein
MMTKKLSHILPNLHASARLLLLLLPMLLALACGGIGGDGGGGPTAVSVAGNTVEPPAGALEISIIYAPEEELYLKEAIEQFNQAYREGRNPVTGQPLAAGEMPIFVHGQSGSSGTVAQGVINALIAPNNTNVARPTIFSPSVSHWLALVNFQTGREIFDVGGSPPTALAPVVMAIWESRLKALQEKNGGEPVGWEELLEVLRSPNGWADYKIPGDRTTVYYGHTDPFISSTALSTLIAEFYASARRGNPDIRRLTLAEVNDKDVQQGVRDIEGLIRHYSSRTTEFKEYIAQGPDYLDFVALEENDLIYINQGKTSYKPPEKLVALYPKEGTFWHEHPFAIPNADWVTPEQRTAAEAFTEFIRSEEIQKKVLESGFRPVNPNVALGYPIVPELGVDPAQPATVLEVPDSDVVAAVQTSWQFVKKQADVLLVIDTSGSMSGDKIEQARTAALAFLDKMPPQNQVGLVQFDSSVNLLVPPASFESNGQQIRDHINGLVANGDTSLYDATKQSLEILQKFRGPADDRIQAVVILSDGQDTSSTTSIQEVTALITASRQDRNPIIVIPVAYGGDADVNALNNIARASATRVQSGDPENIQNVLEIISSYF